MAVTWISYVWGNHIETIAFHVYLNSFAIVKYRKLLTVTLF